MCNSYTITPEGELLVYVGRGVYLPVYRQMNLAIGPFDQGLFLKASDDEARMVGVLGQWGMIRPGQDGRIEYKERPNKRPGGQPVKIPMLKNNARFETVSKSPAFRDAWKHGRRCLIPANTLREPNWETGRCVWWDLQRADRLPWMVAGIWSEWTDPETGEVVPNYAMLTINVDSHPLLNRLHKPEKDKASGKPLPPEAQDKRGEAHIEPKDWDTWLHGTIEEATRLLVPAPPEMFNQTQAQQIDQQLKAIESTMASIDQDDLF
ncbi:MAG: SOS response-associated peptidase family protein [Burkholderiaceae bacterium]|nr:SOS response-associated peptidase family protein [Burkholderiaceae bacterium]